MAFVWKLAATVSAVLVGTLAPGLPAVATQSSHAGSAPATNKPPTVTWAKPRPILGWGPLEISCTSASWCLAINYLGQSLTFDGTRWSHETAFDQRATRTVSCSSPTLCVAADVRGRAAVYDGSRWSRPAKVDTSGAGAVSCALDAGCILVTQNGHAYRYRGGTWHHIASIPGGHGSVDSMSCTSANFCMATTSGYPKRSTAYRFDGRSWQPSRHDDNILWSVSCSAATFCAAIDGANRATTFDGTQWTTPETVDPPGPPGEGGWPNPYNQLLQVSCTAADFCTVVGRAGYVGQWDGSHWHQVFTDEGSSDWQDSRNSVSCAGDGFCAVGGYFRVQTWNAPTWGRWQHVDVPAAADAMSCATDSFCMLAGSDFASATVFDGSTLSVSTSAFPGAGVTWGNVVSVDCVSKNFCAYASDTRIAIYDHGAWVKQSTVDDTDVQSIACASPRLCFAYDDHGRLLKYTGTTWSSPHLKGLSSVTNLSCVAGPLCMAVDGKGHAIVYRHGHWSAPTRIPGANTRTLSVSCGSITMCMIGTADGRAIRFDGTAFHHPVTVFHPSASTPAAYQVSCASSTFCSMIAFRPNGKKSQLKQQTKLKLWRGTRWGNGQTIPNARTHPNRAAVSVSCPSSRRCFANYRIAVASGIVAPASPRKP